MIIRLNNIQVYAHHGCWAEETVIGGEYVVDVAIDVDFTEAALTDDLSKTVDYVEVKEIVYEEMRIPSKLIETVAFRILNRLKTGFPKANDRSVRITKINAPMGGQVESVSVEVNG